MRSDNAAGTPAWESMTDWSGLPDVYVTKAKCQQGMFWRIEAFSVPMAIGPEVRLIREDRVAALIREAEARGMERAAEMMRKPGDIWRTCTTTGGPSNDGQKWVHMSDFNELLRRADAIRTAAATHREGK